MPFFFRRRCRCCRRFRCRRFRRFDTPLPIRQDDGRRHAIDAATTLMPPLRRFQFEAAPPFTPAAEAASLRGCCFATPPYPRYDIMMLVILRRPLSATAPAAAARVYAVFVILHAYRHKMLLERHVIRLRAIMTNIAAFSRLSLPGLSPSSHLAFAACRFSMPLRWHAAIVAFRRLRPRADFDATPCRRRRRHAAPLLRHRCCLRHDLCH